MNGEQAHQLRNEIEAAVERVLGKPCAIVVIAQDEERNIEIMTNAKRVDLVPELLKAATEITREPPTGTVKRSKS